MKLKDVKTDLVGLKIRVPKYKTHDLPKRDMYIKSGWNKGLWLSTDTKENGRVFPLTFSDFKEIENIEIIKENK